MPQYIKTVYLLALLIIYWYSKQEAFWLAFFLVLSDGFMSFFGSFEVTLTIFPGLPSVEVVHFYVILTLLKARTKKSLYPVFYKEVLRILGIYLLILIFLGFFIGITEDVAEYLRIIKLTLPFLLFYSIPRLMNNSNDYEHFFALIFPVAILASFSQLFDIIYSQSPSMFFGAKEVIDLDLKEDEAFRGFFNPGIILLSLFGSLFYSVKKDAPFKSIYLNVIIYSAFSMAFLSATRGWIIGFSVILGLFMLLILKVKMTRLMLFIGLALVMFFLLSNVPLINNQINNAYNRFMTVEKITEGDISAEGTNIRNTIRSPKVMKKWSESPVLGFGFSEEYRKNFDSHVGNQNVLLHSGIVGFSLMLIFFLYFISKLINSAIQTSDNSLFVFAIFFIGWYIIHSTSGQHFSYTQKPSFTLTQIIFFSFGAYCFAASKNLIITK